MERDQGNTASRAAAKPANESDEPVLPTVSTDEEDTGWGDESGARDDEWYRRERPPHHE